MRGSSGKKQSRAVLRTPSPVERLLPTTRQLNWQAAKEMIAALTVEEVGDAVLLIFRSQMPDLYPGAGGSSESSAGAASAASATAAAIPAEPAEPDDELLQERLRQVALADLQRLQGALQSGNDSVTVLEPRHGLSYRFEDSTDPESLYQVQVRLGALGVLAEAGFELN